MILGTVTQALPADVIAQIKAMDPAITPGLAQAVWALLTPFHEKLGYTAPVLAQEHLLRGWCAGHIRSPGADMPR